MSLERLQKIFKRIVVLGVKIDETDFGCGMWLKDVLV